MSAGDDVSTVPPIDSISGGSHGLQASWDAMLRLSWSYDKAALELTWKAAQGAAGKFRNGSLHGPSHRWQTHGESKTAAAVQSVHSSALAASRRLPAMIPAPFPSFHHQRTSMSTSGDSAPNGGLTHFDQGGQAQGLAHQVY